MPTSTHDNAAHSERLIRTFLDGIIAGNEAAIRSTLTENAVFVLPRPTHLGRTIDGGTKVAKYLLELGKQSYTSMSGIYGTVLASDNAAMAEWHLKAVTVNGEPFGQYFCWAFDLVGGKITEVRAYIDTAYGQRENGRIGNRVADEFARPQTS